MTLPIAEQQREMQTRVAKLERNHKMNRPLRREFIWLTARVLRQSISAARNKRRKDRQLVFKEMAA